MLAGRYLYRAFDSCILIGDTARRSFSLSATVPVIYLDRDVVVINKPHGFKSQYYKQVLTRTYVTKASLDDTRTRMILL